MKPWPRRKPKEDKRLVGLTFVEVLFALVIARVLEPFANAGAIPAAGRAQLALAGLVTLASWIGYHNSWNRPRYFIRFPNVPLFQFLTDVSLVCVYWLTAVMAEGVSPNTFDHVSARPETALITISFGLYVLWDLLALRIRNDEQYTLRPREQDVPARRRVTLGCLFIALMTSIIVWSWNPSTSKTVIGVDSWLIALVVLFRFWKEYDTPEDAYSVD
jgi:hypothetical protein